MKINFKNYFFFNKAETELKFLRLVEKDCSNKHFTQAPGFFKDKLSFQN